MSFGNRGGRSPKPVALKVLDGDTRQRGAAKHEAAVRLAGDVPNGLPEKPADMSAKAGEHWDYLMGCAGAAMLFREADAGMVAGVCEMFAEFMGACKVAASFGKIALDESVDVQSRLSAHDAAMQSSKMAEKLYGRYMAGCDRLGMNPSARARLQLGSEADNRTLRRPSPEEWKSRKFGVSA